MILVILILVVIAALIGGGIAYALVSKKTVQVQVPQVDPAVKISQDAVAKEAVVVEAQAKSREIVLEAKDNALKLKTEAEESLRSIRQQQTDIEKDLIARKTQIETREQELEARTRTLRQAKEAIDKKQEEADNLYKTQKEQLEKIANLTKEDARKLLLEKFEKEVAEEKGKRLREMEQDIKKNSEHLAQEILVDAMRFGATDYVVEYTTSRIKLPDEDMKGRIIGKEGRNIQSFEEKSGVELDLDSTPGEIVVSCFDPVRREIAKISLERLIADGRIQPAKIEEIIDKTKQEIEHTMYKEGDNLCHRVGVYNLPPEVIQMLGRFKYRFSYGQNMIEHTLEETRIGVAIAQELHVDVEVVKLGCLLHDIGKIINDEEGTHVQLGVDYLKKHGISEKVVNCVAEHHEDRPFSSIESSVVALADHVSGARPGARSEDYESYVKRMKDLEDAANSFDGVEKAYAISAGREVRVFVRPTIVDDYSTALLAREIAKKIELEQTYPGVVKVTVIRETRVSETAK